MNVSIGRGIYEQGSLMPPPWEPGSCGLDNSRRDLRRGSPRDEGARPPQPSVKYSHRAGFLTRQHFEGNPVHGSLGSTHNFVSQGGRP
jgi:hypothetical protein